MGYEKDTDYHLVRDGNNGSALNGDFLVYCNFENLGDFGLADIYDTEYNTHTRLRLFTLGDDISIKGEMTAEVICVQIHPNDEYHSTYNTYDGQKLSLSSLRSSSARLPKQELLLTPFNSSSLELCSLAKARTP